MVHKHFPLISPIIFGCTVLILGLVTPGYDHMRHTISRLAIEQYGWVQIINFLQFSLGLYLTGVLISTSIVSAASKRTIIRIFSFAALIALFAALIPTDRLEESRISISKFTALGAIHAGIVLLFLIVSPLVINSLVRAFLADPKYMKMGKVTLLAGSLCFIASFIWFLCLGLGMFTEYLGIYQKIIASIVLFWLWMINHHSSSA